MSVAQEREKKSGKELFQLPPLRALTLFAFGCETDFVRFERNPVYKFPDTGGSSETLLRAIAVQAQAGDVVMYRSTTRIEDFFGEPHCAISIEACHEGGSVMELSLGSVGSFRLSSFFEAKQFAMEPI